MRLFKYVCPERIDVLLGQKIRFTQAKYLNDPFEHSPFVNNIISENFANQLYEKELKEFYEGVDTIGFNVKPIIEELPFLSEVLSPLQDGFKAFTTSLVHKAFAGFGQQEFQLEAMQTVWNRRFGILSLTLRNDNMSMWAHYAGDHTGFIIEFDRSNTFFKNSNKPFGNLLRKVKYKKNRESLIPFDTYPIMKPDSQLKNAITVFYTKSYDWKMEQEVRFMYPPEELRVF